MIRFAEVRDIAALKALWDVAFPGERDFCDVIFETHFGPELVMGDERGGGLSAMTFLLPCRLRRGAEDEIPCGYIYAAATHPDFRRQGVMSRLLMAAHGAMAARGDRCSLLIPASEWLFGFYARLGYAPVFPLSRRIVDLADTHPGPAGTTDDLNLLARIYERSFADGSPHVARGRADWRAILLESRAAGGGIIANDSAYAIYLIQNGHLIVREAMGDDRDLSPVLYAAMTAAGAGMASLQRPAGKGHGFPFACARLLTPDDPGEAYTRTRQFFALPGGRWEPYLNLMHN